MATPTATGNGRPPLSVHAVLRDGVLVALHRSVKGASVDAWKRALLADASGGERYRVEAWQVGGFGNEPLRTSAWDVDAARAKKQHKGSTAKWLEELSPPASASSDDDTPVGRVPRVLWNQHMPVLSTAVAEVAEVAEA